MHVMQCETVCLDSAHGMSVRCSHVLEYDSTDSISTTNTNTKLAVQLMQNAALPPPHFSRAAEDEDPSRQLPLSTLVQLRALQSA
jgi:hypothetical protein